MVFLVPFFANLASSISSHFTTTGFHRSAFFPSPFPLHIHPVQSSSPSLIRPNGRHGTAVKVAHFRYSVPAYPWKKPCCHLAGRETNCSGA
ncbi:uncharacterized protein EI90DRAFT_1648425 [Cantharellus anzutake]|uniref:uncharacterized protein n=1 Tax=Cantharellus anzutake TaxID=1750568 RepID=UPI00190382A0|nr:uncharacterized protein EI90DRAFT_1648425 [Cantharellus anzutake]KAF8327949.1 hypothetical protein EI90DRAFT_1648425 [Cantharellus anzutake]